MVGGGGGTHESVLKKLQGNIKSDNTKKLWKNCEKFNEILEKFGKILK